MDVEQRQHQRDLLRAHQSQLRVLELQAATFGAHAPPHVLTEIDRLTTVIAGIEAQLGQPTPAVNRAALRQLRQQALAAYYAETWERAEDLLIQIVQADPADQDARTMLDHTQRQLDLRAFYQAICDLRDDGNWRAVLAALDDLQQRQPDYPGTTELRRWAEDQVTPPALPRPSQPLIEIPPRRRNLREWLEDGGLFVRLSDHPWRFTLIAAMGIALLFLAVSSNRWSAYLRPSSPTATPGLVQLRVVNSRGDGLSVRSAPDSTLRPTKTLPEGTIVTVIGEDVVGPVQTWKHVRGPDGTEGWVRADFLQPVP